MHSYLLTEEQLVENGYPRPTNDPGVASIVRKSDDVSDIKPVGPHGTVESICVWLIKLCYCSQYIIAYVLLKYFIFILYMRSETCALSYAYHSKYDCNSLNITTYIN